MPLKIKSGYRSLLEKTFKSPSYLMGGASILVVISALLFISLGQEFVPTLDESDIAMQSLRIPSTSLTQSSKMQLQVEEVLIKQPEVEFVFSKTGTAEAASDPMPPNASDTFIMLKPQNQWPDPHLTKDNLIIQMEDSLKDLAGNLFEFTQPIEMRFNELIAGTKGDVAIKIYGDDYTLLENIGSQISQVLRKIPGSEDLTVTQAEGFAYFRY